MLAMACGIGDACAVVMAQNDIFWSILTEISKQVEFVVNGALI